MEYGLRDKIACLSQKQIKGLNPCFDGIWSARAALGISVDKLDQRLNPCFDGIWSARVSGI